MEVGLVTERNEQRIGFVCPSVCYVLSLLFTTLDLNIIAKSTFLPFCLSGHTYITCLSKQRIEMVSIF
jgi:hypothetical protein